jgi:hypothetical protein
MVCPESALQASDCVRSITLYLDVPTRTFMIKKKTRINARRVAEIIGCSHKTVLKGGAGTGELTRIRNGTRQIRFILEEVLEFAQRQEEQAAKELKRAIKKQ